jgi:CheY-like chemotaxis protein
MYAVPHPLSPLPLFMNKNGPIVIIEDDSDDQEMLEEVFGELGYKNPTVYFTDGEAALSYLNNTKTIPFLILSDINMPKLSGFELREKLRRDAALEQKCIPYLFFSTAASQESVIEAYSMSVQGFFLKQHSMEALKDTIHAIVEYWKRCAAPNNFE